MKEFIEKLIYQLNEAKFPITDLKQGVMINGIQQTDNAILFDRAIEIVNQLIEEIEVKDCSKCSRRSWYQIGYQDGKKDGLTQANEMVGDLMKDYPIDRLLYELEQK